MIIIFCLLFHLDNNPYGFEHIREFLNELLKLLKNFMNQPMNGSRKAISGCFFLRLWLKYIAERVEWGKVQNYWDLVKGCDHERMMY